MNSKVKEFIINHWVSWMIEIVVLGVIAYCAIAETRKTAEHTREMLTRYDVAISKFASEKTKAIDSTVSSGVEAAKSISTEDVQKLFQSFRKGGDDENIK